MAKVIKITHATDLAKTEVYPYAKWEHPLFNPIQSRLLDIYEGDSNLVLATQTNTGKTISSELYMAYEIRKRGGKAIYIGPMKSLAAEKKRDWSKPTHHFADVNTSICTGDFRMTTSRIAELDASDLILMTPEMLASRCRNQKSEKSNFLKSVGTIVFDEAHLLSETDRGDHIEVALMKMIEINPNVRVVFLSATMPNAEEICGWISKLTKRDTYYLESDFRAVPLHIHYEKYFDGNKRYEENENEKVGTAVGLINYYDKDKWLAFVHGITTGEMLIKALQRHGIECAFHYSKVSFGERTKIEERFSDKTSNLRVVVATSTLAWGCNLPARRVVVVGVDRGVQPISNMGVNIRQEVGRAGRLGLDDRGDAYILVPESKAAEVTRRVKTIEKVRSQLLEDVCGHHKTLAFHVVSEIHYGSVTTRVGFHEWFNRSLAHHQDCGFDDKIVDKVIDLLVKSRAIIVEDNEYKATTIGTVASLFYYSPFDVSDLKRNFSMVFDKNLQDNDLALAVSMGNVDSQKFNIVNKKERLEMASFQLKVEKAYGKGTLLDGAIKAAFAYHNMLSGISSPNFGQLQESLNHDADRTMEVLNAVDTMGAGWKKSAFFKTFRLRLTYGVRAEFVELCQLPGIKKARSEKLYKAGYKTIESVASLTVDKIAAVAGISKDAAKEVHDRATALFVAAN